MRIMSTGDKWQSSIAFILILILAVAHGHLFLSGYRLTADDVAFQYYAMGGWTKILEFTKGIAEAQGRIVHFLDMPFSLLSAFYADELGFRIFYTTLYFLNFFLFSKYISMLMGWQSWRPRLLLVLILFSLHPLDYFHLAPNSYPSHITLPILIIIQSRISLWKIRSSGRRRSIAESFWIISCLVGMMFSEYGFIFALSLIFAEFLARTFGSLVNKSGGLGRQFFYWFPHPYFVKDAIIIIIFLSSYFIFRSQFPSIYDGNKIADKFHLSIFLKTLSGHIYGGTSLASFVRYHLKLKSLFHGINRPDKILAVLVFLITLSTALLIFWLENKNRQKLASINSWWAAPISLIFSIFVTTPNAITGKYQSWCTDINSCIFLDSRLSYLWTSTAIGICILGVIEYKWRSNILGKSIKLILSFAIAFISFLTFLNNCRISYEMKSYVAGWARADALACISPQVLFKIDSILPGMIDPAGQMSFHPGFDKKKYWNDYIDFIRKDGHCINRLVGFSDFISSPKIGKIISFDKKQEGASYLLEGWSSPEGWGAWSDGDQAEIVFPVVESLKSIKIRARALITPNHPQQRIVVSINGVQASTYTLSEATNNVIDIAIPDTAKKDYLSLGLLRVQIKFLDAISPKELNLNEDRRKLSIGLESMTIQ